MTQKSQNHKWSVGILIFESIFLGWNILLLFSFGRDSGNYPAWAANSFFVTQTLLFILIIPSVFAIRFLLKEEAAKRHERKLLRLKRQKEEDLLRMQCTDLDKACQKIDVERFHELCKRTGRSSFTHDELIKEGCVKEIEEKPKDENIKEIFTSKEIEQALLILKSKLDGIADDWNRKPDKIVLDFIKNKSYSKNEARDTLLKFKHYYEPIIDTFCSDEIIEGCLL
ncbi:MAG: hypothetical protein ACP5NZ_01675 [Nanobdellota archaeon]